MAGQVSRDDGPEARAFLGAQGDALRSLLRAVGFIEAGDVDRE